MVSTPQERFELPTNALEVRCSVQTELLGQVLVPIAADPEPGRESPQWSLNHPYNITCLESEVNLVETV